MVERDRIITFDKRRQIAGESDPGHLCPVAVCIVRTPTGLDRLQIAGVECWLQKRMATIDPGVEQADARNFIGVRGRTPFAQAAR